MKPSDNEGVTHWEVKTSEERAGRRQTVMREQLARRKEAYCELDHLLHREAKQLCWARDKGLLSQCPGQGRRVWFSLVACLFGP